ncbi:alpha/beta hydrolase fold domain-containing protein [Mycobacterium sp. 1274761.0]|uniref:alpha/beta hydrolase fold domain-containing protein n=1 Tax=Mycobacterium sp. 1274761.0 TaxID=1834077 RepID=UPI001E4E89A5|nr:alpha/beta hydrolase [Mycobacterium sp. 1274761.0]
MTVRPRSRAESRAHVLYLHGGSYTSSLVQLHWSIVAALLKRTESAVTLPLYPLAPEHTIDDALPFLDAVTRSLEIPKGKRLLYMGDSAGGGLALSYAIRQRDEQLQRQADAIVLFSPWVDVTMQNPDIARYEADDPILNRQQLKTCGTWWAGRREPTDPAVSPLLGNLAGLPPLHVFQGDHDLFLPDVQLLDRLVRQAGGASTLTVVPGGFHIYVGAPWIPEARTSLRMASDVVLSDHR